MQRPRPLRDAALALSLLTLVPTGMRWPAGVRTGVAGWFPAIGLVLGGIVTGGLLLVPETFLESQPLLAAALVVTVFALLTRFLHHDGLADVADAWWGGATPQRRLEIMSDSATGAFGVTALVLTGALQVTAIGALLSAGALAPLLVAPAVARFAATCAAWLGKPAKDGGLGRSVMGRPDVISAFATFAVLGGATWLGWSVAGVAGLAFLAVGVILALAVPHLIASRMGGVTGDVMGASVLVVETGLYVLAAIVVGG